MRKPTNRSSVISWVLTLLLAGIVGTAGASTLVPQTALPGGCIPQFAVPLPVFGPAGPIPRVDAVQNPNITVTFQEIAQSVLPTPTNALHYNSQYYDAFAQGYLNCPAPADLTIQPTRVWAYGISKTDGDKEQLAPANWPAVTVVNQRGLPTTITYKNSLPAYNDPVIINGENKFGLVQGLVTVDQTIDWADPLGDAALNGCTAFPQDPNNVFNPPNPPLNAYCNTPYQGTPPAVAHLHGGESISFVDGGPLQWFTPDGHKGRDYYTESDAGTGTAVFTYDNSQEPGTLWFHDHVMGQTRTNVYSGMAAFYFLKDGPNEPMRLPDGPFDIEMAIQDRQFDTTSQLFFPDGYPDGSSPLLPSTTNPCGTGLAGDPCLNGGPPNPLNHPFWNPEFVGDVAIVNGAPWPKLNVEPRKYRFRLLDGSNARFYNLSFGPAPVWVVGADDNYLNHPVRPSNGTVFLAPGERADVIVDFSRLAGRTITVTNDAPVPFPDGMFPVPHPNPLSPGAILPADQPQMASIMQIVVDKPLSSMDKSCKPETDCRRPRPVVRLTDGNGNVAKGVVIDKYRQLILKEFEGPGGPLMVLVNNSLFMGSPGLVREPFDPMTTITELPQQGTVEQWDIINLTMDAHPMHTHLAQFQILNRQPFDVDGSVNGVNEPNPNGYVGTDANPGAWPSAFGTDSTLPDLYPGCTPGHFCPGYGPPLRYEAQNADGALGGNPAISPYLIGTARPPAPEESGWKDTGKAHPGEVMRILVRFTPTSIPVKNKKSYAGQNLYPFDPTAGQGYVWHCHIVDHEDQDMMRPYKVVQ